MLTLSIGSDPSRDFPDYDTAASTLPTVFTEQIVLEFYNDSEFLTTSGINVTGFTTTPAFNLVLTCAAGQSFTDSAANALRYNQSNGVGFRKTNSYGSVLTVSVPHTEIIGLQISTTGTNNTIGLTESTNTKVDSCIIESSSNVRVVSSTGASASYINTVIVADEGSSTTTRGVRASYTTPNFDNCTFICTFPGNTSFGIEKSGGAANSIIAKNNAFFGFGIPMEPGGWGVGTDYNATDASTLPAGTNNVLSLVASDQFENIASDATLDLRLKAGNSLDGAGISTTVTTDIYGQSRSLMNPSIGAFETQAAGGFDLIDSSNNSSSISNTDNVIITGEFNLTDSLSNSLSASNQDQIVITGEFALIDNLVNSSSLSNQDSISITSFFNVVDTLSNSLSVSNNDSVEITESFTVSDSLNNSASISNDDIITIQGSFDLNDSVSSSTSISNADYIQIGQFTFTVKEQTNINADYFSRNIDAAYFSRNVNGV